MPNSTHSSDIESHAASMTTESLHTLRMKLMGFLFRCVSSPSHEDVPSYSALLEHFSCFMVARINQLTTIIDPVLLDLRIATSAPQEVDRLKFVCSVTATIRDRGNTQTSIEDVCSEVFRAYAIPIDLEGGEALQRLQDVVYALVGCLTMLYQSKPSKTVMHGSCFESYPVDRPLLSIVQELDAICPKPSEPNQVLAEASQDLLQMSLLNFRNLSLPVTGRGIDIRWVDVPSEHLEFDQKTSKLKMFRYPTMCLLYLAQGPEDFTNFLDM